MSKLSEQKQEYEWIERVRLNGPFPLVDPHRCLELPTTCWATPSGDEFLVRGPHYSKTKAKIPAGDHLLKPLGFDWIKAPTKISNLLTNPKTRVGTALRSAPHPSFVWAFNMQLPTTDNHSIVGYFVDVERRGNDSLVGRFLNGDDAFKNSRLKLIVTILEAPWIVRKAVGDQAICMIGKALTCNYLKGHNFLEVDIDVGTSIAAKALFHLTFGYFTTLAVDMAYVIEGRSEAELPERILGAFRFSNLDASLATHLHL